MADNIVELSRNIGRVNQNVAAQGNNFRQAANENNRNITKISKDIGGYFIQQRGTLDNVAESNRQNANSIDSLGKKIDNNSNLITQSVSATNDVASLLRTTNNLLQQIRKNTQQGIGGDSGGISNTSSLSKAAGAAKALSTLLGGGGSIAALGGMSLVGAAGILEKASGSSSVDTGSSPSGVTPSSTPAGRGTSDSSTLTGPAKKILDHMADSEGSNYNTQFGYQNTTGGKKLTEMSIGEVKEAQARQKGSSAIGRYQFMAKTLPEAMKGTGLTDKDMFSAENQDKLAMWLLKRRGYDKWVSGQLSDKDFGRNLSMEWASVPNPYTGGSYYGQKAKYGSDVLLKTLQEAKGSTGGQMTPQSSPTSGGALIPRAGTNQESGTLPINPQTAGSMPTMRDRERTDTGRPTPQSSPTSGGAPAPGYSSTESGKGKIEELQSGIRNQPINERLKSVLQKAADEAGGLTVKVISGGQPSANEGGRRTGSTRHDHGNAADVDLYMGNRKLSPLNSEDKELMKKFVSAASAAGATGIGAGEGYMSSDGSRIHVGFGKPAIWGAGGAGGGAADWLREAVGKSPGGGASGQQENESGKGVPRNSGQGQGLSATNGIPNLSGLGGLGGMGGMPGMGMLGMLPGMGMMGGRMGTFGALAGMALGGLGGMLGSAVAAPSMPYAPTPTTPALQSPQTERGFVSPFANIDESAAQFFAADKLFQNVMKTREIQAAATNRDVNAQKTPTVNINQPQTLENQRNPNVLNPQSGGSDTSVLASWEDSIYRWLGIQKGSNFA